MKRGEYWKEIRRKKIERLKSELGKLYEKNVLTTKDLLEISNKLGFSRSTLFYLLKELDEEGFLVNVDRGRYILTKNYIEYLIKEKPSEISLEIFRNYLRKIKGTIKDESVKEIISDILDLPSEFDSVMTPIIRKAIRLTVFYVDDDEKLFWEYFPRFLVMVAQDQFFKRPVRPTPLNSERRYQKFIEEGGITEDYLLRLIKHLKKHFERGLKELMYDLDILDKAEKNLRKKIKSR